MKVLLDTNVLVSAYATRGLCAEVYRLVLSEHQMVVAEVVLQELDRVLQRKFRLPQREIAEILSFLQTYPVQARPDSIGTHEVPDRDDAWVLASALAAGADVLVTRDPDLLHIAPPVEDLKILTPRGFWELLRQPHTQPETP